MKISEIFYSLQGEGPQTGMPAVFIRMSGCNLDCAYCDSKYAKHGQKKTIPSIVKEVNQHNCPNVILTGGEPMIQPRLMSLIKELGDKNIFIETNGTIYNPSTTGYATFIVSPKLQFMTDKYKETIKKFDNINATFKFVVKTRKHFFNVKEFCEELNIKSNVYIMPQGITKTKIVKRSLSIQSWIKEFAPNFRLSFRLQILLYGNQRGK